MKILKLNAFEKLKINPISLNELDELDEINPTNKFKLSNKDLIGDLTQVPLGIVVRMLEEQENQGNKPDVKIFQKNIGAASSTGELGFDWKKTEAGHDFWNDVICNRRYDMFFKKYPEYEKYNLNKSFTDNKYKISEKDLVKELALVPLGIVVKMLEEQENQGNEPNVEVFQKDIDAPKSGGGFDWDDTVAGWIFWDAIIHKHKYERFFERYPKYEKYNA